VEGFQLNLKLDYSANGAKNNLFNCENFRNQLQPFHENQSFNYGGYFYFVHKIFLSNYKNARQFLVLLVDQKKYFAFVITTQSEKFVEIKARFAQAFRRAIKVTICF
jgi:hypothetical protein